MAALDGGMDAPVTIAEQDPMARELEDWLDKLATFGAPQAGEKQDAAQALLPAGFALASYRASLLPLLGDPNEASLQGPTARLARLPLQLELQDQLQPVADGEVAALTCATLSRSDAFAALAADLEAIIGSDKEASDA